MWAAEGPPPRLTGALRPGRGPLAAALVPMLGLALALPARAVAHFVRWSRDAADQVMKPAFYPQVDKRDFFDFPVTAPARQQQNPVQEDKPPAANAMPAARRAASETPAGPR